MSPVKKNGGAGAREPVAAPPQQVAETVPPTTSHDFYAQHTLTMMAAMQHSIGELSAKVEGLTTSVNGMKTEVKSLNEWRTYAVAFIAAFSLITAIIGFLISKCSDLFVLKSSIPTVQQQSSPTSASSPPSVTSQEKTKPQ